VCFFNISFFVLSSNVSSIMTRNKGNIVGNNRDMCGNDKNYRGYRNGRWCIKIPRVIMHGRKFVLWKCVCYYAFEGNWGEYLCTQKLQVKIVLWTFWAICWCSLVIKPLVKTSIFGILCLGHFVKKTNKTKWNILVLEMGACVDDAYYWPQ